MNSTRVTIAVAALAAAAATSAIAATAGRSARRAERAEYHAGAPLAGKSSGIRFGYPFGRQGDGHCERRIVTQTDIDQRSPSSRSRTGANPNRASRRLRQQVLRNLIDETFRSRLRNRRKSRSSRRRSIAPCARRVQPEDDARAGDRLPPTRGSSIRALWRQIEGEIAWQRLQRAKIESGVVVGDEEVKAVLDKLKPQGYRGISGRRDISRGEPATGSQNHRQCEQDSGTIRSGASFAGYARQYSEASTAAVGGDLGWVRPEQLPSPLAAAVREMGPGTIRQPIPVPGGVSIMTVQDTRKILTARSARRRLSLKQVSINFPKGTSRAVAEPMVARFAHAARRTSEGAAARRKWRPISKGNRPERRVKLRDLPAALQQMMVQIQVGQATPPFGSLDEGVRGARRLRARPSPTRTARATTRSTVSSTRSG